MITMSSWSVPCELNPFGVSTPVIWNGTFLIRKIWPTTSSLPKICVAVVRPITQTLFALRTSWFGERRAVRQRPLPQVEIIGGLAVDARKPVLIPGRDLRVRNDFLAHQRHRRDLAADRFRVLDLQRARAAPAGADAARGGAAGENQNDVLAQPGDLRFDLGLRAVADADHRDDRADADDDAERGKRRTHLVPAQRAEGNLERRARAAWRRAKFPRVIPRLQRIAGRNSFQLRRGIQSVLNRQVALHEAISHHDIAPGVGRDVQLRA